MNSLYCSEVGGGGRGGGGACLGTETYAVRNVDIQ